MLHGKRFVNDLIEITSRLEGCSSDSIGFEVIGAWTSKEECKVWTLELQSYSKTDDIVTEKEQVEDLLIICDRLKWYGDDRYQVVKAEKKESGKWLISVTYYNRAIENEEEDSKEA